MNRRTWVAALTVLGLAVASVASAGPIVVRKTIPMRTSAASIAGGYVDSLFFSNGSGNNVDTTATMSLGDFFPEMSVQRVSPSSAGTGDSLFLFRLSVGPDESNALAGLAVGGLDSLHFTIQASYDAQNWASAALFTILPSPTGTVIGFDRVFSNQWWATSNFGTLSSVNFANLPYWRFLINNGGATGRLKCTATYFREQPVRN